MHVSQRVAGVRVPWPSRVCDDAGRVVAVAREGRKFFQRLRRWDQFATRRERLLVKGAAILALPFGAVLCGASMEWVWYVLPDYVPQGRLPGLVELALESVPPLLIAGPTFVAVFVGFAPVMNRALARAAVSEGRCGSCGYSVGVAGSAGLWVCPECGASWRVGAAPEIRGNEPGETPGTERRAEPPAAFPS